MAEKETQNANSWTAPVLEWRRLRADELRRLAKSDAIVIVPIGSLEQHGPHLPVEVDSLLGETVALRTAQLMAASTPVVVLPCVWTGLSEHHMSFGGTITVSSATFAALISDVCRAIVRHGFKRIVLLNGHGGNDSALRVLTDELAPALGIPIIQLTYWYAAAAPIAAILERQSELLHACEAETSMMMALRPELVARDRLAQAETALTPEVQDLVGPGVYRWRTLAARSSSGVNGYPTAATRVKGERLLTAITEYLAARLARRELWDHPWR